MALPPKFAGMPVRRREAPWLITGTATYVDDLHASGDCRLALARVYTKRALLRALTRAQGGIP
jgi:hypothetical protein